MNSSEIIRQYINDAIADTSRQITLTGNLTIDETILLPADFTVILENCHLTMAENTFCNMFRNEHAGTELGKTPAGCDRNIRILGRGKAVLDGGVYNGLCEGNHSQEGRPHISVNNLLLFANVDGFVVENIQCRNQRWWALNFIACRHGRIANIDFCADDRQIRPDGTMVHGLTWDNYSGIVVKNADGIDLRCGCHDIIIENITGFTEDDTIALTALHGSVEALYGVDALEDSIHNVIVRNVSSAAFCAIVRLLNQGGTRLYNILVDGVMDTAGDCPHLDHGSCGVRIGDFSMYGSRHAYPEETRNITVRNVYAGGDVGVLLAGSITNLCLDNICTFGGCTHAVDNRATLYDADGNRCE